MAATKREARVEQIIAGAAQFFAEHGFAGQTRELSSFLGIAQPLLYRYFPSKQALIHQIFTEFFEERWRSHWCELIRDDALSIEQRLRRFYTEYNRVLLTREWVRLFMYAELAGYGFGKKLIGKLTDEIILPLAAALRLRYGAPSSEVQPITPQEISLLLDLHGLIIYKSIRRHVYGVRSILKWNFILDDYVLHLQGAVPRLYQQIFPGHPLAAPPGPLSPP
ncbi:MAG: TetR/AcrR family transcriptional regulator [Betaproteobacteria bacterium]|nr:TetR/AcrR family transcriptional regulator [Betaproteobacteria bacterium]